MRHLLIGLTLLGACTADVESGEALMVVARQVTFAAREAEVEDGPDISVGVDLDGVDTQMPEEGACFQADFVSPDGRRGVDNAFAFLFELVESFFQEGTVEGIIQGTINEGRLLMMFGVTGVDDWENDESVVLEVFLGDGRPDIGGDGFIVSGQTFDRDLESETIFVSASIVNGALETEAFELTMPMAFFNVFFDLRLHGAKIRAEVSPDGEWRGVVAGAIDGQDVVDLAVQADMMQEIQVSGILENLLPNWVDLGYDASAGTCSQLSATLVFESTRTFVFDEPPTAE
ncbi:MAG: hypothetical protein ACI9KE_001058 [Polyangiales bacterium]|jgi:hypothetical protein